MTRFLFAVGLLLTLTPAIPAGGKTLPTDLGLVPADAASFGHIRLADLWKSPAF